MTIVPDKPNRVAADGLHAFELEVGPDRRGVENPLAGPFVAAGRARAFAPEIMIGEAVDALIGPGEFENLFRLVGPDVAGWVGHESGLGEERVAIVVLS